MAEKELKGNYEALAERMLKAELARQDKKSEEKTILGCMSEIVGALTSRDLDGNPVFSEEVYFMKEEEIAYVGGMCGTTPRQSLLLSCIIEKSCRSRFNKEDLAAVMGLSYIKLLSYESDLQYLHSQKLVLLQKDGTIHLPKHVIRRNSSTTPGRSSR